MRFHVSNAPRLSPALDTPCSRSKSLAASLLRPNMAAQSRYAPSGLDHVEDPEKYWRGGFHPVHLGDKLDEVDSGTFRYEVMHKLGSGGFSTVWLAHDLIDDGYVALQIVCASQSAYGVPLAVASILNSHPNNIFVTELRRFTISGPNGYHVCQVLPVTGPSLMALSQVPYRLQPAACKALARESAQALAWLHARGLCHGGSSRCHWTHVQLLTLRGY